HRGVKRQLAPAERLEELRAVLRGESKWRVARRQLLAPRPVDHLLESRIDDVDHPPLEAGWPMKITGEGFDVRRIEIDEQSFGYDQHARGVSAELTEERLTLRLVPQIEPDRLVSTHRLLVLQRLELVVENLRHIDIDPTKRGREIVHSPRTRVEPRGEI